MVICGCASTREMMTGHSRYDKSQNGNPDAVCLVWAIASAAKSCGPTFSRDGNVPVSFGHRGCDDVMPCVSCMSSAIGIPQLWCCGVGEFSLPASLHLCAASARWSPKPYSNNPFTWKMHVFEYIASAVHGFIELHVEGGRPRSHLLYLQSSATNAKAPEQF